MGYDYHGSWDGQIGHNAPLHLSSNSSNLSPELRLSVVCGTLKAVKHLYHYYKMLVLRRRKLCDIT